MKFIKNIINKIICKHEFEIKEVFYGDMKKYGKGIGICTRCGKRKVIK